jgi:hypothetical protein
MAGRKSESKRSAVESNAILAFMKKCSDDGGYKLDGHFAKEMTFTGNEIYLWDKEGDKLSLVAVLRYSLVLKKSESGDLIKGEVHVNGSTAGIP